MPIVVGDRVRRYYLVELTFSTVPDALTPDGDIVGGLRETLSPASPENPSPRVFELQETWFETRAGRTIYRQGAMFHDPDHQHNVTVGAVIT